MKKSSRMRKKTLKIVEKVVRREIERNMRSWPPRCAGIYHQPKYPRTMNEDIMIK